MTEVQLVHDDGKAANQIQLTRKRPAEPVPFHQIAHRSSGNVDLAFLNALVWAFHANLYSCQLLLFQLDFVGQCEMYL